MPPRPPPFGFWADGSEGWTAADLDAYALEAMAVSAEAWRRALMGLLEDYLPPELRSIAAERVGLTYGRNLRAISRAREEAKKRLAVGPPSE